MALSTEELLNTYVNHLFAREDDALRRIQQGTRNQDMPTISVQPFDGKLLQMLVWALNARKVVEIGTLAGYSGTWLARALPADGRLYTLEKSSKHAAVARQHFADAGVSDRVELLEGDAQTSLDKLSAQGPFDFVFIDADKPGYPGYLEWTAANLRPGGMFAAHNAFSHGRVLAPDTDNSRAIAAFNQLVADHPQFESTIIGMGDGMTIGIKKA